MSLTDWLLGKKSRDTAEDRWSERRKLPWRRPLTTTDLEDSGGRYSVSVGYYETGEVGEVFVHSDLQSGSDKEISLYAMGVQLSLLLQYGIAPENLRHSLPQNDDGTPACLEGRILEIITHEIEAGS